ncbi:hypothetical protein [Thermosynechococcus sp.]|uniref:hypothetical protein n=1 Tax=Thermosynechococcus sp. TaxID=2814275 RepID=UPI00262E42B1|nr:hypothetical protein [Thermosynechococcus sp.]
MTEPGEIKAKLQQRGAQLDSIQSKGSAGEDVKVDIEAKIEALKAKRNKVTQ